MSESSEKLRLQALEARREGRLADAREGLITAVDLCRQNGDDLDLAKALTALGQIERDMHHDDAAIQHYEEAVAIYRAGKDSLRLAHTIRHVGDLHRSAKRSDPAEVCYKDLYRADKTTPPLDLANAIRGYAILKTNAGDKAEAAALWGEARRLYEVANVKEVLKKARGDLQY